MSADEPPERAQQEKDEMMSAYLVEKKHILYLLAAATSNSIDRYGMSWYHNNTSHKLEWCDSERAAEVGNMLWRENMQSLSARYPKESSATLPGCEVGEEVITPDDVNRSNWSTIDPVQVLKAIDCLNYQSCEHESWEASESFAFLRSLKSRAIHALPGYDGAEWGAPEPMRGMVRLGKAVAG